MFLSSHRSMLALRHRTKVVSYYSSCKAAVPSSLDLSLFTSNYQTTLLSTWESRHYTSTSIQTIQNEILIQSNKFLLSHCIFDCSLVSNTCMCIGVVIITSINVYLIRFTSTEHTISPVPECFCEVWRIVDKSVPSSSPGLYWWVAGQECHSDTGQQ